MGRAWVLTAVYVAFGTNLFAVVGLLSGLAAALGVGVPQAGQVQTAFVLAGALAGPPLAIATRRLDRKHVMLASLVLLGCASLACGAVESLGALLATRILAGLAGSLVLPLGAAMVQGLAAPERRGRATATMMLGMPLSLLVTGPVATALGASWGWPTAFVFAGALALGAAVLAGMALPPAPGAAGKPTPLDRAALGRLAPLWAATLLSFVGAFCLSSYLNPLALTLAGVTLGQVGLFQMALGAGSLTGIVIGGRSADRGAGLGALAAGLLTIAACAAAIVAAFTAPLPLPAAGSVLGAAMFASAAGLFSLMPVVQTRLAAAAGPSAPLALALNGSSSYLGQAGGAALGGAAIAGIGLPGAPAAGLAAAAIGAALLLALSRRWTATQPAPAIADHR
jgi:predicted MFS family arabinose efflux permease